MNDRFLARLPAASRSTRRRSGSCARPAARLPEYRRDPRAGHARRDRRRRRAVRRGHAPAGDRGSGVDAAILFADITTPLPGMGVDVEIVRRRRPGHRPADPDRRGRGGAAPVRPGGDGRRRCWRRSGCCAASSTVPLIGFAGAPFTLAVLPRRGPRVARRGRGSRRSCTPSRPPADALLERARGHDVAYLRAQVAAGAQAVQLFDSWVGVLAPARLRAVASCRTCARLFAGWPRWTCRSIHFGTGTAGLLPPMAEAGGDVIGVDWRIGLADAWAAGARTAPSRATSTRPCCWARGRASSAQARWVLARGRRAPGPRLQPGPRRAARDRPRPAAPPGRPRPRGRRGRGRGRVTGARAVPRRVSRRARRMRPRSGSCARRAAGCPRYLALRERHSVHGDRARRRRCARRSAVGCGDALGVGRRGAVRRHHAARRGDGRRRWS